MARKAKPTKAKPAKRVLPAGWRGHDLTTVEGSKASMRAWERRKRMIAREMKGDFEEIRDQLDKIDKLILSVLTDLAGNDEDGTIVEVADMAHASFIIRGTIDSYPKLDEKGSVSP